MMYLARLLLVTALVLPLTAAAAKSSPGSRVFIKLFEVAAKFMPRVVPLPAPNRHIVPDFSSSTQERDIIKPLNETNSFKSLLERAVKKRLNEDSRGFFAKGGSANIIGSPADITLKSIGETVEIWRNAEKIAAVSGRDDVAIVGKILDSLSEAQPNGAGLKLRLEGEFAPSDAARLLINLDAESRRREIGSAEGTIVGGGGNGKPPTNSKSSNAAPDPNPGNNINNSRQKGKKGGHGRADTFGLLRRGSERYDFRMATVIHRATVLPVSGNPYLVFGVDVPSTPSPLDFFVRVFFDTFVSTKDTSRVEGVISSALDQDKLSNATLRQASNEIIRYIRETDQNWHAIIEGNDYVLVTLFSKKSFG